LFVKRQVVTDTAAADYSRRLSEKSGRRWKRLLGVQLPYRWNLRRLDLGYVIDVGCGIGRNLAHLDGRGVGVDHNPVSAQACIDQGFDAFTPADFRVSRHAVSRSFDSLLMAHVAEHMSDGDAVTLMRDYLPFVRDGGKVVVICPQEAGFRTDSSHVRFVDEEALRSLFDVLELELLKLYSFPFPRRFGRFFAYNEFVALGRVRARDR
jgi:SAM-dependent methyltransferase